MSDGKDLVKFGGRLFYLPRQYKRFLGKMLGQFSENISETSFPLGFVLPQVPGEMFRIILVMFS